MDWRPAGEEEQAALKRIVALLFALARLAALAGTQAPIIRCFVLRLLLVGEAAARNLVTLAPAPSPFHHAGTSRADAMRLARRLRNLARTLDRRAAAACAVRHDGIGDGEPARGEVCRTLQLATSLVRQFGLPVPMRDARRSIPDTS